MKVKLGGDTLDTRLYDRDNWEGAGKEALQRLSSKEPVMPEVTTQYDIYAMFDMVHKRCPAIYPEFREKLDKTIKELAAKRGRTRGLVTRMSNDASLLSSGAEALPEGVWLLNILDMGDKEAVEGLSTAIVQVFWVLDFNAGTLVDKTDTLETVQ